MTSEVLVPNSAIVTLARESRGLTQSELAPNVGMSQSRLSKIEAGQLRATAEDVRNLARELSYPESFFYSKQQVYGPGVSEFYHRKRQAVGQTHLRQAYANINILLGHLDRLLRSVELRECLIPRLDTRSATEAALELRAIWQLPPGPIFNLTEAIENAGGIVVTWRFGSPKIDGISRWAPGLPPIFVINSEIPADRARLTLAHELGHMVLHDAPGPEMEVEANQFAAEFLMPAREIRRDLERPSIAQLAKLKPRWRVSMAALLYRAHELRLVTDRMVRHLWVQMAPYRRREPAELDLQPEVPAFLLEILNLHRNELGYSVEELAELLDLHPPELQRRYGLADGTRALRLIK